MYTIRKKFRFEAAHILRTAYSKVCMDSIHGHSYVVEVFLRSNQLDENDMVVDFGWLKDQLQEVFEAFDHSLILPQEFGQPMEGRKPVMLFEQNPTGEILAKELYKDIKAALQGRGATLWKVRVHETETGYAEYEEDE